MGAVLNQYIRQWGLMVNGEPFIVNGTGKQFRVVFDVIVSPMNAQAFADIRIYNLNKGTNIPQGASVSLSAGYVDNHDTIFIGTVTNVLPERDGPNTATRLLCRSGGPTDDRGSANSSYGAGTSVVDVLKDLARSWPRFLELDESQFSDVPNFVSGYIADGDIPQILDSLGYQFGFEWKQDRGTLVIDRIGRERKTQVFEVNQYNGMVGFPEVSLGPQGLGINVTTKINPYIRSNSRINVKSAYSTFNTGNIFISELSGDANANGEYNVFTLHYSGDSHGNEWDLNIDGLLYNPNVAAVSSVVSNGSLIWGARVEEAFRAKVREVATSLRIDPNWLMAIMAFETGNTFNPAEVNRAGSGATGLIQFLPSTARGLGTTTAQLARMTGVQQLDYVRMYFEPYAGRIRNIGDAYMAVFMPKGINKPDTYVLIDQDVSPTAYRQNAGLDKNYDGKITRGEATERVNNSFKEGMKFLR